MSYFNTQGIFSYISRKARTYTINMLELFAYSKIYSCISILLYIGSTLSPLYFLKILTGIIFLTWALGWIYIIYKQENKIEELEATVASLTITNPKDIREDLAALMHSIWAKDVIQNSALTLGEQYRANTPYYDLIEDDKLVNLDKADAVLNLFNIYKNNN